MSDMSHNSYQHPVITDLCQNGYPATPEGEMCAGGNHELGKHVYTIEGEHYCQDCFVAWVTDYAKSNPEDVANQLNVEHERGA